jgi:hypothetical protein
LLSTLPSRRFRGTQTVSLPLPLPLRGRELVLAVTLMLSVAPAARGQVEPPSPEYRAKAAYLLNFTRYVEWPPEAFSAPDTPLAICILGKDPFGEVLDQAIQGRRSQGHSVTVRRLRSNEVAEGCHLVFLTDGTWLRRKRLIIGLTLQGILTVGDSEQFVRYGGGIGFVMSKEAVRFVINMNAMERAGLKVSSRLLSLAVALHTKGPRF